MKRLKTWAVLTALLTMSLSLIGCGLFAGSGPAAAHKAYVESMKNKDPAAMKKVLSKGALAMLENRAKEKDRSLDDLLKEMSVSPGDAEWMQESRNEKINGDSATLEVRGSKGGTDDWLTLPLVKESGEWKVALDKIKG